jgi:TonB family protein
MTGWYSVLAGAAVKSILLLGAAGLVAILMRSRSAAARHVLWTAAFAGLLALPLLTASLPAWPAATLPGILFQTTASFEPRRDVGQAFRPAAALVGGTSAESRRQPGRAAPLVFRVWLAGTVISLSQMALAWLAAASIRRRARPLRGISIEGVPVLECGPGAMPMTFGLLRPAIFLPCDAAAWTAERRRVVLLHELAHVERGDAATHLFARAALSLYWWNPLAWWAWRQFVRERERAADDVVLSVGTRPSDYAGHLLEIARTAEATRAIGWAAVAMLPIGGRKKVHRSQLERRLVAILDSSVNRNAPRPATRWMAALATIVLIAPLAALRAQDTQTIPADVDATIRAAAAQKNHEMLDKAAKAAEAYRQYDLARKLLDSSLVIRAEASGQGSADYGIGLLKLGDLERERLNFAEAEAFYTKAVSVLGGHSEAAPALIDLGLLAMRNKDAQKAFDYFSKVQAADPAKPGRALMWMAVVRDQQKDPAAANELFRQALAAQQPNSAEAATTMRVYAGFLQRQGREEEARNLSAQASVAGDILRSAQFRQRAGRTPVRVAGGVTAPVLIQKVEPEYSEEARAARYQGTVVVAVTVDSDGTARDMQVVRGLGLGLDEKALQAISQWRFKPGAKDGQPVPVMATIEVNFRLL